MSKYCSDWCGIEVASADAGKVEITMPWRQDVGQYSGFLHAGLIGALFPVVVADLTRGSGHFNATQGAVGMVHACGGILSQLLGGVIVVQAGYNTAFLLLAVIAGLGGALFWLGMPESRDYAGQRALAERNPQSA